MKNLIVAAGIAAATTAIVPTAAAQNLPDAKIGVVDVERVIGTCNACVTANATLQQQAAAVQARQGELTAPLQAEGQAIQTAINALNGAEPDAALQQRAQAFNQRQAAANRELQQRSAIVQRNSQYVLQQIGAALDPAYAQVQARRNASLLVSVNSTLAHSPAVDLTADVLAELNRTLTVIQTNAPAPQQQQPQTTPAPTGR